MDIFPIILLGLVIGLGLFVLWKFRAINFLISSEIEKFSQEIDIEPLRVGLLKDVEEVVQKGISEVVGQFNEELQDKFKVLEQIGTEKLSQVRSEAGLKGVEAKQRKAMQKRFEEAQLQILAKQNPLLMPVLHSLPIIGDYLAGNPDQLPLALEIGKPYLDTMLPQLINKLPGSAQEKLKGIIDKIQNQGGGIEEIQDALQLDKDTITDILTGGLGI